jgi:hypothetical protein
MSGFFRDLRYCFRADNHARLLMQLIPKSRPNPNFQKTLRDFDGEGGPPSTSHLQHYLAVVGNHIEVFCSAGLDGSGIFLRAAYFY